MRKLKKQNAENIQAIFEEKTGVNVTRNIKIRNYAVGKMAGGVAVAAGVLVCFGAVTMFTQSKMPGNTLTTGERAETYMVDMPQMSMEADGIEVTVYAPVLAYDDWVWPTESERISAAFDMVGNDRGITHDHINIAGEKGDAIYSVADGTVTETGYVAAYGNCIVVDYGDGILVKYGHLNDIYVEKGDKVIKGQKIGSMGATGMATGPNLSFTVYKDGVAVNPIAE